MKYPKIFKRRKHQKILKISPGDYVEVEGVVVTISEIAISLDDVNIRGYAISKCLERDL